jgi:hypothetical protein
MVFVNPHLQENDLSIIQDDESQIVNIELQQNLAILGLAINEYGSLEVQKLKTQELETQELCIGEVCVNENQLKELLENAGINAVTPELECTPIYYYYDGDGDGYGYIQGGPQITCIKPDDYVANNTDCNDEDSDINPGITEVCDDEIDNNCDGIIDDCIIETTPTTTPTTTSITTPTTTTATPTEPVCTPEWECNNWLELVETIGCGELFNQTRTCTDINTCEIEDGKPIEIQEAIGTDCTICGITSCDGLNLIGECQNTCVDGSCSTCIPTCACAEGFYDCDSDGTCETQGECSVLDPESATSTDIK